MDWRSLKQNYKKSLAMILLEILCSLCSSCVLLGWFCFDFKVWSSWGSWGLWGLILAELLYFWVLLNLLWCCLWFGCLVMCKNALGRLLFIGVGGWVSDTSLMPHGFMCWPPIAAMPTHICMLISLSARMWRCVVPRVYDWNVSQF